jgi:hypothetical protein
MLISTFASPTKFHRDRIWRVAMDRIASRID